MTRPKSEHPKRVIIGLRITDETALLIDSLRGGWSRSEWLRQAAKAAAAKPLRGPR